MADTSVVRVLIVDDSAMMRSLLRMGLSADPTIEVVGALSSGDQAWDWLQTNTADVMTLDLAMPKGDGLSLLRRLMPTRPMPVVVISGLTQDGAEATLAAMEAGAVDVIAKPVMGAERSLAGMMDEICVRVRAAAGAKPSSGRVVARMSEGRVRPLLAAPAFAKRAVIAVGASTGGVQALARILPMFPADTPGMVLVQHMPAGFTKAFATRLDALCAMNVVEAQDGDAVRKGTVLVAPGGTRHMTLQRAGSGYRVVLNEGDPVCHSRPSVDVMFNSVAKAAGADAVGVILTGMGKDGAEGMLAMRRAGAKTLGQDEATCVVYGMPQAAVMAGGVMAVAPLDDIPGRVMRVLATQNPAPAEPIRQGIFAQSTRPD